MKQKRFRHFAYVLAASVFTAAFMSGTVSAENVYAPYLSYEYNNYDETVAAPVGYMVDEIVSSSSLELSVPMDSPTELIKGVNGHFYILDSNNSRVIELDSELKLAQVHDSFRDTDGGELKFKGAQALGMNSSGDFYIGDTENHRILVFSSKHVLINTVERPDEALKNVDSPFRVTRLLVDGENRIYALADSINMGAFVFDENGKFLSFYGSNPVKKTSEVILNAIRKKFLTREQMAGLVSSTPTTFTSFAYNHEGFIYTVTADTAATAQTGNVRLLNYEGINVLNSAAFGDTESNRGYFEDIRHTELCDVAEDDGRFLNLLDRGRGKVFQYTESGKLVTVFGIFSSQKGGFVSPVAIESRGSGILVLDAGKNELISFKTTVYGNDIRTAFLNIGTTDTKTLEESCRRILSQNTNSVIPYYGLGMMYDAQEKYSLAMEQFKISQGCRQEYSNAFRQQRQIFIRQNFGLIALAVVLIAGGVVFLLSFFGKKMQLDTGDGVYTRAESKYFFPFYTAFHPIDGFEQFKTRKNASVLLSVIIVISWFLITTLQFFKTGYCFNTNRATDYSLVITLFKTILLFILFVVANWSVCTLLNGKGSFKDIVAVTAYSLCPMLIAMLVNILLSNALSLDEQAFMGIVGFIGLLWSGAELVLGMYSIHQYSFSKTVFSLILTCIGMAVIIFLVILFYSLLQQTFGFGESVATELSLR